MRRSFIYILLSSLAGLLFYNCSISHQKDSNPPGILPINVLSYNISSDTLEIITDSDFIWDPLAVDIITKRKKIGTINEGKTQIRIDFTKRKLLLLCALIKDKNYKLKNNISIGLHQKEIAKALKTNTRKSFINIFKHKVIAFYDPRGEEYEIYLKFNDDLILNEIQIKRANAKILCKEKK